MAIVNNVNNLYWHIPINVYADQQEQVLCHIKCKTENMVNTIYQTNLTTNMEKRQNLGIPQPNKGF